jgi:Phage tail tube protein FII
MDGIPTKINMFNIYNTGNRLLGVSNEVTMPDLEALSETISGAGILGEIDDPTVGHFGAMPQEVPFRVLDEEAVGMMDPTAPVNLTLRAAQQVSTVDGAVVFKPMRIVMRGKNKSLSIGSVQQAQAMGTTITMELTYLLIELGGKPMVELDKLNSVFKLRGVDILAKAREMC